MSKKKTSRSNRTKQKRPAAAGRPRTKQVARASAKSEAPPAAVVPSATICQHGPWGALEYFDTFLEAPDRLIEKITLPSSQTVWNFEGATEARLVDLFENVALSDDQKRLVLNRGVWTALPNGIRVFPPPQVIEALSPVSRRSIYSILARSEMNPYHRSPFLFDRPDLREALDRSGLPEPLVEKLQRLTYRSGKVLAFSDFPHFLRYLRHPSDERRLLRILTRTRTLLLRLNIDGENDLAGVGRYWASGRQQSRVLPLIESVVATRGVDTIDLIHLLPAGPRSQLFTYPVQEDFMSGRAPDSVWTALNFFNHEPVPIFLESPNLEDYLRSGYTPSRGTHQFGDVLMMRRTEEKRICHACVYLADDLVFTKNGASLMTPWILSSLENTINCHARGSRIEIQAWRRKTS